MRAERRRKDIKLLSEFLFASFIYVLKAHGIGEKLIQLRFVFHDSLFLNITPLEILLVDDKSTVALLVFITNSVFPSTWQRRLQKIFGASFFHLASITTQGKSF